MACINQRIRVITSPVGLCGKGRIVCLVGSIILQQGIRGFIIKIIIELNGINIVFGDNFFNNTTNPRLNFRYAGIENKAVRCGPSPLRMRIKHTGWRVR
ncbi:hypothetical protein ALP20_02116 [Pseudomonas coronafaciens pv. coronafaciens]|nr:hypothetical protein ALP20_02116 [Pseudomonas coronafaciens pv. coronafaciens]